ncbi:SH3 domain-containing protein [Spiribacter halobius]|uniref:SH3b domain-containing protein n=1 Tax=Sediminicurvatus halobius TaxID=2182432 RepID=A0A2U2N4W6_9GAMM|nr:SH3 domain-containing protein [Spiribacter halobius]PWG64024.1 hypothetical protein DEM34_05840 [Spiribacter halobius]UEX76922.1 SH3 domain-containing protein [Spiribacter halobius]
MSARLTLLAATMALATLAATPAQADRRAELYDAAWAAWHEPDYPAAYELLAEFRELPYGRQAVTDFMLATSACRIEGVRDYGARLLDWILYAYALSADSRQVVAEERRRCGPAAAPEPPSQIVEARSAGMTGYGKTFYWANAEEQPVASYPIRRTRPMDREVLTARRVPLGDRAAAAALAAELAPGARHLVTDKFLLISHAGHDAGDLAEIGRTLDRFVGFLVTTYDVVPPGHYLRVELVTDGWAVKQLALERHGLGASSATIGYAFVEDTSVVAAVPTNAAGTVLHELFHLLVRSNFGDVPQWLDEGIASLYEVAGRRGDVYFGLENWRREVLETTWADRPSVGELIRAEWFLFDDPEQARAQSEAEPPPDLHDRVEGRRQAAMMAMARYFALYLQEQEKLVPVYEAVRDRGLNHGERPAPEHAVALVEEIVGRPIDEIDRAFVAWFNDAPPPTPQPRTTGGSLHVTTANLNLRTGPGTGYERLTTLPAGTRLAVTGETDGWRQVTLEDGTTAFVSADYLQPVEVVEKSLPAD